MPKTQNRFRVVDTPIQKPGQCAVCLSVSRPPFIDTGIDDPWSGTLYICFGCIGDFSEALEPEDKPDPEPEPESEAFQRGWREAFRVISEDLRGMADHYSLHPVADEPGDSGEPADLFTLVDAEDSEGQEGSGTSADEPAIKDGSTSKRKGSNSVSGNSGDGTVFIGAPGD